MKAIIASLLCIYNKFKWFLHFLIDFFRYIVDKSDNTKYNYKDRSYWCVASLSILLYENIDSGKWWWTMIRGKWVVSPDYKDSYIEVLTENLLPLRTKADITQEELASMIGISRQTYYALENRRRQMSWSTYLSLVLFFDTNVETHSMLRDINAYPTDLMIKMSGRG